MKKTLSAGKKRRAAPKTSTHESLRTRIARILDLLEARWHNEETPPDLKHQEPLDGLILTVLSQHTNDKNRDVAFVRLKERFPSWDKAAAAKAAEIEEAVRPAGLAPTKAGRIIAILKAVHKDFHRYSIRQLKERSLDEARQYLVALPGVGGKTAACVLLFDMGLPAFPVDTHVTRVCQRLGIVPAKMGADEICAVLERNVDSKRFLGAHINLIEHGRAICKARGPECAACPVADLCAFFAAQGAMEQP